MRRIEESHRHVVTQMQIGRRRCIPGRLQVRDQLLAVRRRDVRGRDLRQTLGEVLRVGGRALQAILDQYTPVGRVSGSNARRNLRLRIHEVSAYGPGARDHLLPFSVGPVLPIAR